MPAAAIDCLIAIDALVDVMDMVLDDEDVTSVRAVVKQEMDKALLRVDTAYAEAYRTAQYGVLQTRLRSLYEVAQQMISDSIEEEGE